MSAIKFFKHNRKIICYIDHSFGHFNVYTGKPSDASCIGWTYDNLEDAMETATEYFENYTNGMKDSFVRSILDVKGGAA